MEKSDADKMAKIYKNISPYALSFIEAYDIDVSPYGVGPSFIETIQGNHSTREKLGRIKRLKSSINFGTNYILRRTDIPEYEEFATPNGQEAKFPILKRQLDKVSEIMDLLYEAQFYKGGKYSVRSEAKTEKDKQKVSELFQKINKPDCGFFFGREDVYLIILENENFDEILSNQKLIPEKMSYKMIREEYTLEEIKAIRDLVLQYGKDSKLSIPQVVKKLKSIDMINYAKEIMPELLADLEIAEKLEPKFTLQLEQEQAEEDSKKERERKTREQAKNDIKKQIELDAKRELERKLEEQKRKEQERLEAREPMSQEELYRDNGKNYTFIGPRQPISVDSVGFYFSGNKGIDAYPTFKKKLAEKLARLREQKRTSTTKPILYITSDLDLEDAVIALEEFRNFAEENGLTRDTIDGITVNWGMGYINGRFPDYNLHRFCTADKDRQYKEWLDDLVEEHVPGIGLERIEKDKKGISVYSTKGVKPTKKNTKALEDFKKAIFTPFVSFENEEEGKLYFVDFERLSKRLEDKVKYVLSKTYYIPKKKDSRGDEEHGDI